MILANSELQDSCFKKASIASYTTIFVTMSQLSIYFAHLPILFERLALTETLLGVWLLCFGISNVVCGQIVARRIVPTFGSCMCMCFGVSLYSLTFVILNFINSVQPFFVVAIISGCAFGFFLAPSQTHLHLVEKKFSENLQPFYWAMQSLGSVTGAAIAIIFLRSQFNIINTFNLMALIGVASVFVIRHYSIPQKFDVSEPAKTLKLPNKKVMAFGALMTFQFATVGIIMEWSPLWLTKTLQAPLFLSAILLIGFHSGEAVSRFMGAFLMKRYHDRYLGCYLVLAGALALAGSIFTMDYYIISCGAFLFGFASGNFNPIIIKNALRYAEEDASTTIANLLTLGLAGLMFGPAIVSVTAQFLGMTFNMYLLALVWGICAVIFYLIIRKDPKP